MQDVYSRSREVKLGKDDNLPPTLTLFQDLLCRTCKSEISQPSFVNDMLQTS